MRELFDARLNLDDKPMSQAELVEAVKTADVLVPTVTDRIDAAVLAKAGEQLKLIANFGNGVDNIDVDGRGRARHHRHQHARRPHRGHRRHDHGADPGGAAPAREGAAVLTEDKRWAGWSPTWMLGHRICGKRLGIIGMGRIGQAVARRARAFGLQIHYHNRRRVRAADRGGAGGDLLGEPRPDAGAHGHHLGQLPAHAGDLSPALGAPAQADAAATPISSTPRAAK